jgi:hypothetical protein
MLSHPLSPVLPRLLAVARRLAPGRITVEVNDLDGVRYLEFLFHDVPGPSLGRLPFTAGHVLREYCRAHGLVGDLCVIALPAEPAPRPAVRRRRPTATARRRASTRRVRRSA